jgi:coproporphyrinogen III oxidase-like Fe-S oxidoreductase
LWRPACIAAAIAEIRERFAGTPREVTIEANPTDCTDDNLAAWRAAGIDRVSIGVQSHDAATLVTLGRDHRFGDGRAAVERTMAAGFTTSADFIGGVPGGPAAIEVDTQPDHLSVYELTIEPRTAFGQRVRDGRLVPLDEDTLASIYTATHERLAAAGYDHYEISSYARPGKRAVHNSLYWRGAAFLGLGVGAASLELAPDGSGVRQTNPRRAAEYLADPGAPAERIASDPSELAADRAWLGMRTSDGVDEADLAGAPGVAANLVAEGLAERRAGRICPTLRGFLMADRIAAKIVEAWRKSGDERVGPL